MDAAKASRLCNRRLTASNEEAVACTEIHPFSRVPEHNALRPHKPTRVAWTFPLTQSKSGVARGAPGRPKAILPQRQYKNYSMRFLSRWPLLTIICDVSGSTSAWPRSSAAARRCAWGDRCARSFHRSQRNWKLDYDGCWRATPLRTVRCAAGPTTLQWAGAKFIHLPSFATRAAPWQEFCGRLGTTGQGFRSAGLRQTRRSGGS